MKKYLVQYIEEREDDDDWDRQWETDDKDKAIREAKVMLESSNIDAVRVLKTECIFEEYDPNSNDRPWSK